MDNVRPFSIFTGYMSLALALTATIIRRIYLDASTLKNETYLSARFYIFGPLAALSLAVTWSHMFNFFSWSYQSWAVEHDIDPQISQFGNWLKDTKLFEQAWGEAMNSSGRFWWTQNIFFITAGWSVYLGFEGSRRGMKHLWLFMLLGQIVAISFAINLSFIALLGLSAQKGERRTGKGSIRTAPRGLLAAILLATFACVFLIPHFSRGPLFMLVLALPHIMLFLPLLVPQCWSLNHATAGEAQRYLLPIFQLVLVISLALHVRATFEVSRASEANSVFGLIENLRYALHEHPAVSSVGWDVLLCYLSIFINSIKHRFGSRVPA